MRAAILHLPSTGTLRAFEAAARLGSFTRAAIELNITQSAVSQAVRQLELSLGRPLFERKGAGLTPTPAGRRYAAAVAASLEDLVEATRAAAASRPQLNVSCARSLLLKWLLPRLQSFIAEHPAVDVQLTGSGAGDATLAGDVNIVAAEHGHEPPGAVLLHRDQLALVAAPEIAVRLGSDLSRLGDVPRIDAFGAQWTDWCMAAGVAAPEVGPASVRLREATTIIEGAIAGLGVALVSSLLSQDDVRLGRLVVLSDVTVPRRRHFWLATRGQRSDGAGEAFVNWLRSGLTERR